MIVNFKKPIDWTDSIKMCENWVKKDKEHGHKLPYRAGDVVLTKKRGKGVLIHKEFLYHSVDLNRDVWFLIVQYGNVCRTFNDASHVRKFNAGKRQ